LIFADKINAMKLVVTGGSGHAGQALVEYLFQQDHDFLVVDRQSPRQSGIPYNTPRRLINREP
jgi:nucleoside-diphosphate-sugar epimerase